MRLILEKLTYGHAKPIGEISHEFTQVGYTVLLGKNGAGKSTLLATMAEEIPSLSGTVSFILDSGAVEDAPGLFSHFSKIDTPSFYPDMTVGEHAYTLGIEKDNPTLEAFQVLEFWDEFPRSLSSGEQQRVFLALHLAFPQEIILLDEPEKNLDAHWGKVVRDYLLTGDVCEKIIIIATHSPAFAEKADCTVVIG